MTPKQRLFVQEYIIDYNATQAAIRAGYSYKSARSIGCENLTKPYILKKITELMEEREKRVQIGNDMVIMYLKEVVTRCLQREPVLDRNGRFVGEWKFNASGANTALRILGEALGMFK